MPQLKWDKFWSFFNNSMVSYAWWAFQVSQGTVVYRQYSGEVENVYVLLQQIYIK